MNEHLADFDRYADQAREVIVNRWNGPDSKRIIALARRRLLEGFETFPDGPMFKKTHDELVVEADEEAADELVYVVQQIVLDQPSATPGEL